MASTRSPKASGKQTSAGEHIASRKRPTRPRNPTPETATHYRNGAAPRTPPSSPGSPTIDVQPRSPRNHLGKAKASPRAIVDAQDGPQRDTARSVRMAQGGVSNLSPTWVDRMGRCVVSTGFGLCGGSGLRGLAACGSTTGDRISPLLRFRF